ncbi:hypothetical protein C8Q73DRAFT_711061 [Cubamyces lactineus]|nr:hypothetical protein C8Q73DRAFT_711061 [Cubamyces lactineus]
MLQIVMVCRQLRRLRIDIDLQLAKESFKYFSRIISTVHTLEELVIQPPFDIERRELTELFRPRLRKLTFLGPSRNGSRLHEFPLGVLPATLEELDLSAIKNTWTMSSGIAFPRIHSLKIPFPDDPLLMGRLMQAVPGLQSLNIIGQLYAPGRFRTADGDIIPISKFVSSSRAQLQRFWKADPTRWPRSLVSVTAEIPSFLHALAVPAQVYHCSVSFCNLFDTAIPLLSVIFDEATPSSVECSFAARYCKPLFRQDYFQFLSTTKSLISCTLTFDYISLLERSGRLIDVIIRELGNASSLRQLLLNDTAGIALFDETLLAHRATDEDKRGGREKASYSLALRMASAAPALQWICIYTQLCDLPPQAWRITRSAKAAEGQSGSPQSEDVSLQRVSEDEAQRIFGTNFGRQAALV